MIRPGLSSAAMSLSHQDEDTLWDPELLSEREMESPMGIGTFLSCNDPKSSALAENNLLPKESNVGVSENAWAHPACQKRMQKTHWNVALDFPATSPRVAHSTHRACSSPNSFPGRWG